MLRDSAKNEVTPLDSKGILRFFSPTTFSAYSHIALVIYAFGAALSIALSQSVISVLLIYWMLCSWVTYRSLERRAHEADLSTGNAEHWLRGPALLAVPMLCWVLVSLTSTLIGINPVRGLPEVFKTSFYLLLPFCIYSSLTWSRLNEGEFLRRIRTYLVALLAGQTVAALHTIINSGFLDIITINPPGPVTESGQAVLTIAAVLALLFLGMRNPSQGQNNNHSTWLWEYFMPISTFAGCLLVAWANALFSEKYPQLVIISQILGLTLILAFSPRVFRNFYKWIRRPLLFRGVDSHEFRTVLLFFSCLVFAAFVVNLKRGPWLGVFSLCLMTGAALSRRLVLVTVSLTILLVIALAPARERVLHFANDFAISGGRQNMWSLGLELSQRYPLGLGLENAVVIRQLDPSLPEQHRHMHNNLLNVAAESGVIGLLIFIWWMISAVQLGYRGWLAFRSSNHRLAKQRAILSITLAAGLVGWQVAGLVEYNFGDGEVCMIALMLMGLIAAVVSGPTNQPRSRQTRDAVTTTA